MKIKITCKIIKSDLEKSDFQMKISECDCVVCAIISKSSLKSIFINVKILILSYKINYFAFTKIVLEQRYLSRVERFVKRVKNWFGTRKSEWRVWKEVFRASISKGKNLKKILNILVYLDIS